MKKYVFTVFFVCILGVQPFLAQEANIPLQKQLSSEIKLEKNKLNAGYPMNAKVFFTLSDGKTGFFKGERDKAGYRFQHYDNEINLINSGHLPLDTKREYFTDVFANKDNLYMLSPYYDKSSGTVGYLLYSTSINAFDFKKSTLFELSKDQIFKTGISLYGIGLGLGNIDSDDGGKLVLSEKKNYIVFTLGLRNEEEETRIVKVYDGQMQKVYETEFKRPVSDKDFELQNVVIDDQDGSVYILGKIYSKHAKKKNDGGKYEYELYKVSHREAEKLSIKTGDKFVNSLKLVIKKDKLFCIGFYSEKNDNRFGGISYFDIDKNSLILKNTKYNPFSERFMMDKYGDKKNKELKDIEFRNIHISDLGECIFNAEEYTFNINANPEFARSGTHYDFDDIISLKLDAEGNLVWARNINKKQSSSNYSRYLSYKSVYYNDKTYFFINSSDQIKELSNNRLEFVGARKQKKLNLYVLTLDIEGDFNYRKLLDADETDFPFDVTYALVSDDNSSIIFEGQDDDKRQYLRILLE